MKLLAGVGQVRELAGNRKPNRRPKGWLVREKGSGLASGVGSVLVVGRIGVTSL